MPVRRLVWPLALLAVLDATAGLGCDTDETADATPTLVTTPPGAPAEPDASPITDTGDDSGTDDDRGEGTVSDTPTPAATPTQNVAPRPPLEAGAVALGAALGGLTFNRAVEVLPYPPGWTNGGGDVLVAEQGGHVFLVSGGRASVFLDMSAAVPHRGNEEGLLSLVTDPAFLDGRPYLYAYYSVVDGERRTRLSRFAVENGQPGDELTLLEVAQPYANHNGGAVRFGSDGMLYLGLGDGGSGGDPDGNGQNLTTLLGSIIRIDVSGASAGEPYAIPPDNPFVLGQGAPEIWAYGLRNPWRMSFDPATGALWAAGVGRNRFEEVNVVERGGNYGWNLMEGTQCYLDGCDPTADELLLPVSVYGRDLGCSVSGGVVYRGEAIPALRGHYLFGDVCSGRIWALPVDGSGSPLQILSTDGVISFATMPDGEVLVVTFDSVHPLVPAE